MKPRLPLFTKVISLAFLNLCLLALAMAFIVRVQFRTDARSFLLAPAQDRIIAVAHVLSLELDETPPITWDSVLARYSRMHGVEFHLLDEWGNRLAGPEIRLPREVMDRVPRRGRRREGGPPPERDSAREPEPEPAAPPPERVRERRAPSPPLFLFATANPARYWAGVRIPVRREGDANPKPGTLVLMSPSVLGGNLFFDFKPWLTVIAAVILVSLAVWFPFIRGMTQSIRQMKLAAERMAEGQFDIHVSGRRRDEIGQLGESVNRMAARLAGFVNGQKRFLGGIAHELSTPIATMQFGLGNLERKLDGQHSESVADIQEEVQHMSALVDELLSFSRAGMQAMNAKLVPVNVADTVRRVIEREAPPDVPVVATVDPGLHALAEPEYLFRALSNVVRNAVRYAGHAGPIGIAARAERDRLFLTVGDHGPGVPDDAVEEIFAPFFRLDPSRNHQTGGVGLGLAIVKASIEACRGAVRCRNRRPSGLEVEIELAFVKVG